MTCTQRVLCQYPATIYNFCASTQQLFTICVEICSNYLQFRCWYADTIYNFCGSTQPLFTISVLVGSNHLQFLCGSTQQLFTISVEVCSNCLQFPWKYAATIFNFCASTLQLRSIPGPILGNYVFVISVLVPDYIRGRAIILVSAFNP
jgi:hypothetical protein